MTTQDSSPVSSPSSTTSSTRASPTWTPTWGLPRSTARGSWNWGRAPGRILIPLARAGFTVTGVDTSNDMMSICRQRLGYEPAEVQARATLVKADVLGLDLGKRFDFVIAPCNFINYFTGPEDGDRVIQSTLLHLSAKGTFLLENGVPDISLMEKTDGVEQEFEFEHPLTGTTLVYRVTARYDFAMQTETDYMVLEERDEGRILCSSEASETRVYYFPRQVRLMLVAAGFEILHEQGSMMEDIPISEDAGEMVFFCRRRDDGAKERTTRKAKGRS